MRNRLPILSLGLVCALTISGLAQAQQAEQRAGSNQGMQHGMPGMGGAAGHEMNSPFQKEVMAAMHQMHEGMMKGLMDTQPEVAWRKSMIAHHQGAVDMSRIVLNHTKDPTVIKEAKETAQKNEADLSKLQAELPK